MSNSVKNVFGVAAAIIVLLGFNYATDQTFTDTQPTSVKNESVSEVSTADQKPVSTLSDLNNAIVEIAERSNPAVVTVKTEVVREQRVVNPLEQFFGNPFGQRERQGETREQIQRGLGSGVLVSADGYILTNDHVVGDASEIKVRLYNGDEVDAELIGTDPQTDIAVIKVDMEDAPSLNFGNSDNLRVGSFVLAIGSPLQENLAHTVSFGIVSAKGRNIGLINQGLGYEDFIQTDAAINPGNSGGALVDMNGNLIGINSAIASRSGGNDGIGFSIPANLAKRIMDDLIKDGEVSRGYLGMYYAGEVDRVMARGLGLGDARGIIVGRVEDGGPADDAGLMREDIIVSINNEQVRDWNSFRSLIATFKPGDRVELGILRKGEKETLRVTLGERPNEEVASNNTRTDSRDMEEKLGFNVVDLTENITRQLQLENETEGVVVSQIKETSDAYERGLRRGMVITAISREKIQNTDDFYEKVEEAIEDGNEVLLLSVKTGNDLEQFIAFEL